MGYLGIADTRLNGYREYIIVDEKNSAKMSDL